MSVPHPVQWENGSLHTISFKEISVSIGVFVRTGNYSIRSAKHQPGFTMGGHATLRTDEDCLYLESQFCNIAFTAANHPAEWGTYIVLATRSFYLSGDGRS